MARKVKSSESTGSSKKIRPALTPEARGYFSENVFTFRQYLTELIRLAK